MTDATTGIAPGIVIVEDEILIAKDLELCLGRLGYRVCGVAATAAEAFGLIEQYRPALALMDIVLQGDMDGIELAGIIRERWGIPVVFVTSYSDRDIIRRAKAVHPLGYLLKPFRERELMITIEVALGAAQAESERKKALESHRNSENKLSSLIERLGAGVAIMQDGKRVFYNSLVYKTLGYTREEYENADPLSFVHPDDRPGFLEALRTQPPAETASDTIESRILSKNGEIKWVEANLLNVEWEGRPAIQVVMRDVTKSKEAESSLRKSEEIYRLLADNSLDAIWTMNLDLEFTYINPACERLTGFTPEEWIGSRLPEHCDQENFEKMSLVILDELAKGHEGTGVVFEAVMLRKNGDPFWVEIHGKVLYDDSGVPVGLQGTTRDISERKKSELELETSRSLLEATLESTADGILVIGADGKWSGFNQRFMDMCNIRNSHREAGDYQAAAESVRGMLFDRDGFIDGIENDDDDPDMVSFKEIRLRDGRFFEIYSQPQRLDGSVVGRVFSFRDVTEQKKNVEALAGAHRLLTSMLDAVPDLIAVIDRQFKIQYSNYKGHDQVIPNNRGLLDVCYGRFKLLDSPCENCLVRSVFETGDMLETESVNPADGRLREVRAFPIMDGDHQTQLVLVYVRDITERKQAEGEKRKLQAQLQQAQKMEAIGTLAGGVSHDFNNLLQAINGYTQMLLMEKKRDDRDFESLSAIKEAGKRARGLVRQLLLFSRKADTEFKPIDLNAEITQVQKVFSRTLPKMIEIDAHLEGRIWCVNADSVQMEQILFNLGTNAAAAMPGGGRLLIETKNIVLDKPKGDETLGIRAGRCVLLTVSDTGCGMDKETQTKIFEPFFTTKEIGKGTGLGLASVYGIVKNHGGYIECLSEPGRGTTFNIYLPAMDEGDYGDDDYEFETPPGGDETILIVDDEESVRGVASQVLGKFGYNILTARNGEEALECYTANPGKIDLVIMDMGMPGMGGGRCIKEILHFDSLAKIIIASGYSMNDQVVGCLEAGALEYVAKPYELADLLRKIRAVFDGEFERSK